MDSIGGIGIPIILALIFSKCEWTEKSLDCGDQKGILIAMASLRRVCESNRRGFDGSGMTVSFIFELKKGVNTYVLGSFLAMQQAHSDNDHYILESLFF